MGTHLGRLSAEDFGMDDAVPAPSLVFDVSMSKQNQAHPVLALIV